MSCGRFCSPAPPRRVCRRAHRIRGLSTRTMFVFILLQVMKIVFCESSTSETRKSPPLGAHHRRADPSSVPRFRYGIEEDISFVVPPGEERCVAELIPQGSGDHIRETGLGNTAIRAYPFLMGTVRVTETRSASEPSVDVGVFEIRGPHEDFPGRDDIQLRSLPARNASEFHVRAHVGGKYSICVVNRDARASALSSFVGASAAEKTADSLLVQISYSIQRTNNTKPAHETNSVHISLADLDEHVTKLRSTTEAHAALLPRGKSEGKGAAARMIENSTQCLVSFSVYCKPIFFGFGPLFVVWRA